MWILLSSRFFFISSLGVVVTLPLAASTSFSLPPPTFKWSTSSAIKKKKRLQLLYSHFMWLLLSRPVFPCEAAQLCVLMGLLKLLPCYPLSQHWTPSQGTKREFMMKKRIYLERYKCILFPHPLVLLFPCPLLVLAQNEKKTLGIGFYLYLYTYRLNMDTQNGLI